jgi:hypothetical protein
MIGANLFVANTTTLFVSDIVKQKIIETWLPRKTQIAMVELFAVVVAAAAFADIIKGKRLLIFVDAEAIQGAVIKGYSGRADICELVGLFWAIVRELDVLVYIDRVPTDMNPADLPSRGMIQKCQDLGWRQRLFDIMTLGHGGLGEAGIQLWGGKWVYTGLGDPSTSEGNPRSPLG